MTTAQASIIDPAADATSQERSVQELRREAVRLFGGCDITDVTICIGIKDARGNRQEVIRQIQDSAEFRIVKCLHDVEEQMSVKKQDGDIVGFEPTGKYRLKLDVVFVRN